MEDKKARLIYITLSTDEKLGEELNASKVIEQALEKHWAAKDAAKHLVSVTNELVETLDMVYKQNERILEDLKKIKAKAQVY